MHSRVGWAADLWFFLLVPGFVLPFFTPARAFYIAAWLLGSSEMSGG